MLVEQLLDIPGSRFRAALYGDARFVGWDDATVIAADTRDGLYALIAGLSKHKLGDTDLYPRPTRPTITMNPASIAEFSESGFFGWMNN